jgi:hypothetical protein
LNNIIELAKLTVGTKKHEAFSLVYKLLKLVLVLSVATAISGEVILGDENHEDDIMQSCCNQFMNGCIVCFLEPICLATIPNDVIIDGFRKMEDVK